MESAATTYGYHNQLVLTWTLTEATPSAFRQKIDWGHNLNISNRMGIYLVADSNNTTNIRIFLQPRTILPSVSNPVIVAAEPIMEELDNNNRCRKTFFIDPNSIIYAEPKQYNGINGGAQVQNLYAFQLTPKLIKYYGL